MPICEEVSISFFLLKRNDEELLCCDNGGVDPLPPEEILQNQIIVFKPSTKHKSKHKL